jgi:hypothetical protein
MRMTDRHGYTGWGAFVVLALSLLGAAGLIAVILFAASRVSAPAESIDRGLCVESRMQFFPQGHPRTPAVPVLSLSLGRSRRNSPDSTG